MRACPICYVSFLFIILKFYNDFYTVKLGSGSGENVRHGPVLLYKDKKWWTICDRGFTDMNAKVVCRELGYVDGRSICCSAYGEIPEKIMANKSLSCDGSEQSATECLIESKCGPYSTYASVVCLNSTYSEDDGEISQLGLTAPVIAITGMLQVE